MGVTTLAQLAICDYCQQRIADRCHVRRKTHMCPRCTIFIEAATGENLTREEVQPKIA